MARGWSGAILTSDGGVRVGPVTLRDDRITDLRELLLDLSSPGLCLVLGAGASYGVVPMSRKDIAALARELIAAGGNYRLLPERQQRHLAENPEVLALTNLLREIPPDAWDRFLADLPALTPSQATVIWSDVFTPRGEIPRALVDIYRVLENQNGVVVSYNYDGIADRQDRFPVITPHGRRPAVLTDPRVREQVRKVAWELHVSIATDWHLPVPEDESVRMRRDYQNTLVAWRLARCIMFIGYGFGGGDDGVSFDDFGRNALGCRVHVLCPHPENRDLRRQVGYALRDRGPRFRVFGQPFRWRSFAEATLALLAQSGFDHVRHAIGREADLCALHDER